MQHGVRDTGLGSNGCGSKRIVAGDHDGFNAHFTQFGKALCNTRFDDVLEFYHAERASIFCNHERGGATARYGIGLTLQLWHNSVPRILGPTDNGIRCPFSDLTRSKVDARHTALGCKRYEGGVFSCTQRRK